MMQTYRVKATIADNHTLLIEGLPFQVGDTVEVLVRSHESDTSKTNLYPLRDTPIQYIDPFESIVEDAWDAIS